MPDLVAMRKPWRGAEAVSCGVEGCDRAAETGPGWCRAHYNRWIKKGDVLAHIPVIPRHKDRGCAVEGCSRPHKGHGLCRVHLMRKRSTGDVKADLPIRERVASEWLRAHVTYQEDGCLIWPYTRNRQGYGSVSRTIIGGERGNIGAARAMCILVHGRPPTDEHVAAHSCGNGHGGCVHPRHLRWATVAENIADTLHHGTRRTLGLSGQRSLRPIQVRAVRLLAQEMDDIEIAEVFGITVDHAERLTRIVRRQ